jgi:predicted DNA-binding transcriptional regulator AlpA
MQDSLKHFDSLPDAAHVRLPVVAALFACSYATVWRGVRAGRLPKPLKLFDRASAWNVGELRLALKIGRWDKVPSCRERP